MQGGILIIDYGSQYTQLIARRIREFNVYCEIHPYNKVNHKLLKLLNPKGFILSGGPSSILKKGATNIPKCINNISKPILGICYGLQLLTNIKGGKIKKTLRREYGHAKLEILHSSKILPKAWDNISPSVWMSHGDSISQVPKNFKVIAKSKNNIISIIENKKEKIFGLQFHPEVHHTKNGKDLIRNFVFKIWKGSEEKNILNQLKKQYKKVSYCKPRSSRNESSEIFIVAENFIV